MDHAPVAPAQAPTDDPPLQGRTYRVADDAYSAFKAGDYSLAAAKARESIALRPDLLRLRLLLVDALVAGNDLPGARQTIDEAAKAFKGAPELASRQKDVGERLAQEPAQEAYKALQAGDAATAERQARVAVSDAPEVMSHRLLLLNSQLADNKLPEALQTATSASELEPKNYVPLVWRGYIDQRMGDRKSAVALFDAALLLPDLPETAKKTIALIAADAALTSNDPQTALGLLQRLPRYDPDVLPRLADAEGATANEGKLPDNPQDLPAPTQDCQTTPTGVVCDLNAPPPRNVLVANQDNAAPAISLPDLAEPGVDAANRAYAAQRERKYSVAIAAAKEAIAAAPDNVSYRLLLVNLLATARRFHEAEAAATDALSLGKSRAELLAQRGFARNQQRNISGAMADWDAALAEGLPAAQVRNVRLTLADAALSAKQPERALSAIGSLSSGYDSNIRRAYALQALGQKEEALAAFRLAEASARTGEQRSAAIKAVIALLIELDRKAEARALLADAGSQNQLGSVREVDLAYLSAQAGDDKAALEHFDRAREQGQLPPRAALDAGYTAKRQFHNQKAIAYLENAIDAVHAGQLDLDPQRLFETRREIADISRVWGINSSVFFGKTGAAPNPFAITTPTGGYTSQFGTEIYYRPELFGYQNGATFEIFTRFFDTLYDQSHGPTGIDTAQGMVGARWKPFSNYNLVLEVDKLYAYGKFARDDTLLRGAYSYTVGTDLRAVEQSWWTWQVYSEVDRYLQNPQLVALAEARFGRSYRVDWLNQNLVFFPHLVVAASYDDSFATKDAYGAGAGASMRYWFGGSEYIAPPSYFELTLQYRWRLAGDARAGGIFAQALVNY